MLSLFLLITSYSAYGTQKGIYYNPKESSIVAWQTNENGVTTTVIKKLRSGEFTSHATVEKEIEIEKEKVKVEVETYLKFKIAQKEAEISNLKLLAELPYADMD